MMRANLAVLLLLFTALPKAEAKPFKSCGSLQYRKNRTALFFVPRAGMNDMVYPLTDRGPDNQSQTVSVLIVKALSVGDMKQVCIQGSVYRDATGLLRLLPLSASAVPYN